MRDWAQALRSRQCHRRPGTAFPDMPWAPSTTCGRTSRPCRFSARVGGGWVRHSALTRRDLGRATAVRGTSAPPAFDQGQQRRAGSALPDEYAPAGRSSSCSPRALAQRTRSRSTRRAVRLGSPRSCAHVARVVVANAKKLRQILRGQGQDRSARRAPAGRAFARIKGASASRAGARRAAVEWRADRASGWIMGAAVRRCGGRGEGRSRVCSQRGLDPGHRSASSEAD
jgi:hypothetical protein